MISFLMNLNIVRNKFPRLSYFQARKFAEAHWANMLNLDSDIAEVPDDLSSLITEYVPIGKLLVAQIGTILSRLSTKNGLNLMTNHRGILSQPRRIIKFLI